MAKVIVTIDVDVDLDGWAAEYGIKVSSAVTQMLADLRDPGWYLNEPKWTELARVNGVKAVMVI